MRRRILFLVAWLLLVVVFIGSLGLGCDSYQVITFENRTSSAVKVDLRQVPLDYVGIPELSYSDPRLSPIPAGETERAVTSVRKEREIGRKSKYAVVAAAETHEVVYSHVFTWDELHDLGWKILIEPGQSG